MHASGRELYDSRMGRCVTSTGLSWQLQCRCVDGAKTAKVASSHRCWRGGPLTESWPHTGMSCGFGGVKLDNIFPLGPPATAQPPHGMGRLTCGAVVAPLISPCYCCRMLACQVQTCMPILLLKAALLFSCIPKVRIWDGGCASVMEVRTACLRLVRCGGGLCL